MVASTRARRVKRLPMWLLTFLFGLTTLALAWLCFLYFIALFWIGRLRGAAASHAPSDDLPFLSLVIPCFNEAEGILEKLRNLRALDYPQERIEAVFADGGSTDGTVARLRESIGEEWIRVHACSRGGKIHQMNEVLPSLRGQIVVLTDADAMLRPDALRMLVAEMESAPDIAVVGAYCRPADVTPLDQHFWLSQNRGRLLESDVHSASIVVAPCYAFRRSLLASFPGDVVADDIYVAYLAHAEGLRVLYSRQAIATELRGPRSLGEFLPHKFRKANAFLRESLRFLYRLPEMNAFCKTMFLTRLGQQLMMPWALLWWGMMAGVLLTLFRYDLVLIGTALLVLCFLLTALAFWRVRIPEPTPRFRLTTILGGYLLANVILISVALSYPFFRQGSSYARLGRRFRREEADPTPVVE